MATTPNAATTHHGHEHSYTHNRARSRGALWAIVLVWVALYASFTLFSPALLDDADSVHAEVAREMLLRHDFVTLHANGIRYLEKAPLLYWSMAGFMRVSQALGHGEPQALAVAARVPLALTMLALALVCEAFARRLFRSQRAGLYAALMMLLSFGMFLFTRITIPDAMVCLWTALAVYCYFRTEELSAADEHALRVQTRLWCGGFAVACALNVLTKGLIGVVFPLMIVVLHLLLTRGVRGAWQRARSLHPWATLEAFLLIAAPWHILAGLANPTQGVPAAFHFVHGHWQVPLPSDGNVRGWFWFYFMNEHVLRYLNLRVPHDYDTSPLWLFWGLCFVWMMPWSAFFARATAWAAPLLTFSKDAARREQASAYRQRLRGFSLTRNERALALLLVWASFVLLFFALSTRQEYYVLPALPALAILLAGWLVRAHDAASQRTRERGTLILLAIGVAFTVAAGFVLLHTQPPAPGTDLASLLTQHPGDYALSMGHFLDLNARALGLFRVPLVMAAAALLLGPLAAFVLFRKGCAHGAQLALAADAGLFLVAAHMGLVIFSSTLTSAQLAAAIAPQVRAGDLVCIHGEYEAGSTLGFYLQRPSKPGNEVHILEGRSSNLWYGSFFPDAPHIFETPQSIAAKWTGEQRIFLWQSLTDPPNRLPVLPGPVYILVKSGGKEIVSNRPNR